MKKMSKSLKKRAHKKKSRIPFENLRECNIINLAFERILAKKPDNYFSGHKEPDYVHTAEVTQPRLKRPGAGRPEVIDRNNKTGINQHEVNNKK